MLYNLCSLVILANFVCYCQANLCSHMILAWHVYCGIFSFADLRAQPLCSSLNTKLLLKTQEKVPFSVGVDVNVALNRCDFILIEVSQSKIVSFYPL